MNITTKQIGDSYEYYIYNSVKEDFEELWLWKNIPESILYELNIIKDYKIFSKYRNDIQQINNNSNNNSNNKTINIIQFGRENALDI